jgi:hypothetical protein
MYIVLAVGLERRHGGSCCDILLEGVEELLDSAMLLDTKIFCTRVLFMVITGRQRCSTRSHLSHNDTRQSKEHHQPQQAEKMMIITDVILSNQPEARG